jgi:hypothetical protein
MYSLSYVVQCELGHFALGLLVASLAGWLLLRWTLITSLMLSPDKRIRGWSWAVLLSWCCLWACLSHFIEDWTINWF